MDKDQALQIFLVFKAKNFLTLLSFLDLKEN